MYFVLTTENTTDLAIETEMAKDRFVLLVTKKDFSVRVVARMVTVRGLVDFLFINRDQLAAPVLSGANVIGIGEKQWETAFQSWKHIRQTELSDPYIRLWLQSETERNL